MTTKRKSTKRTASRSGGYLLFVPVGRSKKGKWSGLKMGPRLPHTIKVKPFIYIPPKPKYRVAPSSLFDLRPLKSKR